MSNNVSYSFVSDSPDTITFRSTVNSFGLDHVTDKDITSFYSQFSQFAHTDTGLLPVDGSGLLSVRSAGPHTQIAYQHKPGMYYINWGTHEGDPSAIKYYIAQPYRIVIADLLNGNILGARTFYSPNPITYPEAPLYHVNLPNINCRGYRGNAVGWICLYHNDDISNYPFNEKLIKILDRCSGTEAYNDANMSETDGPRFYRDNGKPLHLWDPTLWQSYSRDNGYEWTLDSDLWIPVLVKDKDNQDKHYDSGQPLTFVDAITGNCKMYYYDENPVKPYNMLSRPDISLPSSTVFSWFKNSYNFSKSHFSNVDTFSQAADIRIKIANTPVTLFDENVCDCDSCGETHPENHFTTIYGGSIYCQECVNEYATWVEHIEQYVWNDNEDLYYDEQSDAYYMLTDYPYYYICDNCSAVHIYHHTDNLKKVNRWFSSDPNYPQSLCDNCVESHFYIDGQKVLPTLCKCYNCQTPVPDPINSTYQSKVRLHEDPNHEEAFGTSYDAFCNKCWYEHIETEPSSEDTPW